MTMIFYAKDNDNYGGNDGSDDGSNNYGSNNNDRNSKLISYTPAL